MASNNDNETLPVISGLVAGVAFLVLFSLAISSSFVPMQSLADSGNNQNLQPGSIGSDKIVFSGTMFNETKSQIYIVNSDGTNPTNLTEDDKGAWHFVPLASPDGSKIAYARTDRSPNVSSKEIFRAQIYIMNSDGTSKEIVTDGYHPSNISKIDNDDNEAKANSTKIHVGTYQLGRFAWSPDSTKIAYEAQGGIFVADISAETGANKTVKITDGPENVIDAHPVWLTDNTIAFESIVFNSTRQVIGDSYKQVNIDGTNLKQLFEMYNERDIGFFWSNDRRHIAFIHFGSDAENIYVLRMPYEDINGVNGIILRQAKLLLTGEIFNSIDGISWSQDDRKIAILGGLELHMLPGGNGLDTDPRFRFYTVDPFSGNGHARALALPSGKTFGLNSPVWSTGAHWSSDGKIAYMASTGEEESAVSIYVINADGSENKEILSMQNSSIPVQDPIGWISQP